MLQYSALDSMPQEPLLHALFMLHRRGQDEMYTRSAFALALLWRRHLNSDDSGAPSRYRLAPSFEHTSQYHEHRAFVLIPHVLEPLCHHRARRSMDHQPLVHLQIARSSTELTEQCTKHEPPRRQVR